VTGIARRRADFGDHRGMRAALLLFVVACGGPSTHPVTLVNQTPRTIAEVFVYPPGAANHGASRGSLAPGASLVIKVRGGNVEFLAISEKVKVTQTESETKQASSTIQLVKPVQLIFHDSDQPAPAFENKTQIGVTFRVSKPPPVAEPPAEN